ncbi:MAG TPA: serine hydrolase [Verrucomicrobiae bacterium]|nr:serine hydrolase [Verrucomicrobiae bacterium]
MTVPHRFTLTFVLLGAICAAQQAVRPVPINADAKGRLEKDIPALMHKADVPGLSIAVIRDGKTVWTGSFGVRSEENKQPVTSETMFNVGSLSKPVFAYGVLKLVDAGKLKLDEPLAPYLPSEMTASDPRFKQITARIVLSHRTGFPNWPGDGKPLTIHFTPGEKFSYSGSGMVFLQKAIEKITGKPLNDYMQEAVFTPLGMKHSSYVWNAAFENEVAIGHDAGGATTNLYKSDQANAAASLATTAEDYAAFLDAILAGKGLRPETVREMETPEIAVDTGCVNCVDGKPSGQLSTKVFWGLGFGIEKTAAGESLWHWGDNGVFKAFFVVRPKSKAGVVYMTNSENGLSISQQIVGETLGGEQPAFAWLKYDNYDSPTFLFARMVYEEGAAAALGEFSANLAKGEISESTVNDTGYGLMRKKKMADAILLFQKNVEIHPDSWNAYDSLGEAYMNNGEKELAVKNYQKSVELNPENSNGVETLKKLAAK